MQLQFDERGTLSQVKLAPEQLSHTRLGACLLDRAWGAKVQAPSARCVCRAPNSGTPSC